MGLVGCGAPGPKTPTPGPVTHAAAFNHALHSTGLRGDKAPRCLDCHVLVDAPTGRVARPGSNEHAPCDTCHAAEFAKPPGPFCAMCHAAVEPRKVEEAQLTDWPPGAAMRRRSSRFDHSVHLDADKMEKRLGFHVGCRDCHLRKEGEERAALAGHAGCAPCHGGDAVKDGGKRPPITMADCQKCHESEALAVPQGRRMITGDLKFSHVKHERDLAGDAIACANCHKSMANQSTVDQITLPAMVDCAKCHEDPKRTRETARISNCNLCHSQISGGVAPRNHLGGQAPDSHTIRFRSDHADAARSPQARCRFCHGGLSSTTKDNCFECHVVMKPRDHSLRWATTDHGPEAAMDRQRCATCHEADYCARCHSQKPRSHIPFESFINGGHAVEARWNLRACMACHTFEDTCGRCHQGAAFPTGRTR